ncbi:branched-chain amino acid ABC transporter permease [Paralcaligenes sp. KSB-10]|uniref:branched-chain amino acid ABC transporter permease n=1 Tax=Paralcaligenes sp. KSB-10 TaxID=2901142 RepID=UPI001E2CCA1A|nr:branched-chain amino acid ABC transporter permease [Paralcaligenes sp. KSB-10]UHL64692.1 branched-chain amino acid ABC transporter permease [Paralcaligenes sp. KSB-10]
MSEGSSGRYDVRILFGLWLVFLLFPWVAPNGYIVGLGVMFCINLILVASLNLIMGYCGQISLCHGGFFGLGAYVSGVLSSKYGIPGLIDIFCAMALTAFSALLVALPTLRLRGHYLAMATLGFNAILSVLFVELVGLTGGPNGLSGVNPIHIFGLPFGTDRWFFYLAWMVSLLVMWGILNLVRSRVGRAITSLADSEIGAASLGINTYGLKVMVFVLSASLAALAGSLYVHYTQFASPETFNFFASVLLVMMVAVGGWGKYWGPLFGALVFTVIPELLQSFHDLQLLIFGVGMIAVLMFVPGGIAGMLERLWRRRIRMKAGGGIAAPEVGND